METLRLPLREIGQRFTRSELVMMGWRSAEVSKNMDQARPTPTVSAAPTDPRLPENIRSHIPGIPPSDLPGTDLEYLERRLGPIADKLENAEGELDLTQLTGAEVLKYMSTFGIGGRG